MPIAKRPILLRLLRNFPLALCGCVQPSVQNRTGESQGRNAYAPLQKGMVYQDETSSCLANFAKRFSTRRADRRSWRLGDTVGEFLNS
jgi:hypothetical protein